MTFCLALLTPTSYGVRALAAFRVVECFFSSSISKDTAVVVSPTLDNFKVVIMMNQKEIETLISIRKNLAILEEGGVKSQACPLPAEVCSLALVGLSLTH